jgi:hypothetical protein
MPQRRRDVEYFRNKARAFRQIASEAETPLSERLRAIAAELEAKADEVEAARPDPPAEH